MKIEAIEALFTSKSYSEIIEIFNKNYQYLNSDISDENAHHFAIATFSYYHNGDYYQSVSVGQKLIRYMVKTKRIEVGGSLIQALAETILDSYVKLNQNVKAYLFVRDIAKKISLSDEVRTIRERLRLEVSSLIAVLIERFLLVSAVIMVLAQNIFAVWTRIDYLLMVGALIFLSLSFFLGRNQIQQIIHKLL